MQRHGIGDSAERSLRHAKAVSYVAHGAQIDGSIGIVLYLFAQPADMHVERARVTQVICVPNFFHQLLAAEDLAWIAHE